MQQAQRKTAIFCKMYSIYSVWIQPFMPTEEVIIQHSIGHAKHRDKDRGFCTDNKVIYFSFIWQCLLYPCMHFSVCITKHTDLSENNEF